MVLFLVFQLLVEEVASYFYFLFQSALNHHLYFSFFVGILSHAINKYKCCYINLSTKIYKISIKTDNINQIFQAGLKNLNIMVFTVNILEKKYNFKLK